MTASITRPLVLALVLAMPVAGTARAETRPPLPSLGQMDADGNGTVTVDEADGFFDRQPGGDQENGDPGAPPAGKPHDGKRPEGKPHDGKGPDGKGPDGERRPGDRPAKGDHARPPGGKGADANGDGVISKGEFDAMMKRRPAPPAN